MNIERLTARNKDGFAYLVNVKPDEQEVDSPHKNTLKCILDCFERLAQYEDEDEAIARQSVKSEEVQEAIECFEDTLQFISGEPQEKDHRLAITAMQDYQPWVSVDDRLPEDSIPVFVTYIGFSDGKPYSDGVAKWSIELNGYNGGWAWTIDDSEVTVEITHWKPLPEPPKGG